MIDTLTSLRLIFALMVFASHLTAVSEASFTRHIFKEGYVGVSFFFILSGFIIAYNYCKKIDSGACNRKDFYIARIARIYPLHLLTLAIATLTGASFVASEAASWLRLFMSATLTNAYIPRSDFFFAFNAPAWSLCCEQLFYIIFPLAISFIKSPKKLIIISLLGIIIATAGTFITPDSYIKGIWYTNPVTRLPDFFVGVLLWHIYNLIKNNRLTFLQASILETLSILLFILFYTTAQDVHKILRYSFYYWLPISTIIITFSLQKGIFSRILSHKVFVEGGKISFSFYLIHYFVLNTVGAHKGNLSPCESAIIAFIITTIISLLSYYYFEKPANRIVKKTLGYKE